MFKGLFFIFTNMVFCKSLCVTILLFKYITCFFKIPFLFHMLISEGMCKPFKEAAANVDHSLCE